MKYALALISALVIASITTWGYTIQPAQAGANVSVLRDSCGMFDAYRNNVIKGVLAKVVETPSGYIKVTCKVDMDNPTGNPITYDAYNNPYPEYSPLPCEMLGLLTTDWWENISTSGQATMMCQFSNIPPVLNPIGNKEAIENILLTFTATATDIDKPTQTLSFSLAGAPAGASITPDGVFTWTPTEDQGPGSYIFNVFVSDGFATAVETITVTVTEVISLT